MIDLLSESCISLPRIKVKTSLLPFCEVFYASLVVQVCSRHHGNSMRAHRIEVLCCIAVWCACSLVIFTY